MSDPQTRRILSLLRERRDGVTPLDALNVVGSFRLAARIKELRDAGHDIETVNERTPGGARVARYVLHEPARAAAGQVPLWR
jgi:hypothetical protein